MIYTDAELREKIYEMLKDFETEVVEFKEANEYSGRFYTPIPEIGNHRSDMKETAIPF